MHLAPAASTLEPRQRWRLVFRRGVEACELVHKEVVERWAAAILASGLPVALTEAQPPRPRLAFAAPVPAGMMAEREVVDLLLGRRLPMDEVRTALVSGLPAGHSLVEIFDVWLGEPPLAGRLVAADYRVDLDASGGSLRTGQLEAAIGVLLGATRLERVHQKGGECLTRDLRPLIRSLELHEENTAPQLVMRLLIGPSAGAGRPRDVLGALSDEIGHEISSTSIVRERLLLEGDEPAG